MRFSEAKGRKVVSTSTADTVGKVDRLVVDPATKSVVALELKKTHEASGLAWANITSFGTDAVTVAAEDKLAEHTEEVEVLAAKDRRILGKMVLDNAGDELGTIKDVDFDPANGTITSLLLTDGNVAEVPGSRLIGIGSYAVVVAAE
ncbi:hypothetical protein GCM10027020_15750 [Nocardioides salsibiostraticola]